MSADNNKPEKRPGKFGKLLNFIVSVFGVLIISIFLSIVIEWLGIVFDWWQLPQHYHAKNMFDAELNWALGDFLLLFDWCDWRVNVNQIHLTVVTPFHLCCHF
jgi:hypothetical protein